MSAEYLELVQRWSLQASQPAAAAQPVRVMLFAFPDIPDIEPTEES
jgi:hypothetical protein